MDISKLINRLDQLEAHLSLGLQEAARIKKALCSVSTEGNKNKSGLTEEQAAKLLAKRRKNQNRSNERNRQKMGITL